ncbi:MAG: exosortase/archaeosortase family protein [Alphaproteobacteria bacterium]|nr:exosortase/archaeosortase family protein [Alphaproteobacteria bacterium SS10]
MTVLKQMPGWLVTSVAFVIAVLLHQEAWQYILQQALRPERFDFCIIALLLVGYFIYRKQDVLRFGMPSIWMLLAVIGGSLVASSLAASADILVLTHLAALAAAGGVLIAGLLPSGRVAGGVATAAMVFTLPIPGIVNDLLTPMLQRADARIVEFTLRALEFDAVRQGNQVFTNEAVIRIEQSCNGLMLLWPILVSSFLGFWLSSYTVASRVRLIAAIAVLALIANLLRLLGISFAYVLLPETDANLVHDILGYGTMVAFGVLPLVLLDPVLTAQQMVSDEPKPSALKPLAAPVCFAAICALVIGVAAPTTVAAERRAVPLPIAHGGWVSEALDITDQELQILAPRAIAKRRYVNMDGPGQEVVLLVAIYDNAMEAGAHNADRCFEALGWTKLQHRSLSMVSFGEGASAASQQVQEYVFQRLYFRQRVFEALVPLDVEDGATAGTVARIQLVLPEGLTAARNQSLLREFGSLVSEIEL